MKTAKGEWNYINEWKKKKEEDAKAYHAGEAVATVSSGQKREKKVSVHLTMHSCSGSAVIIFVCFLRLAASVCFGSYPFSSFPFRNTSFNENQPTESSHPFLEIRT